MARSDGRAFGRGGRLLTLLEWRRSAILRKGEIAREIVGKCSVFLLVGGLGVRYEALLVRPARFGGLEGVETELEGLSKPKLLLL